MLFLFHTLQVGCTSALACNANKRNSPALSNIDCLSLVCCCYVCVFSPSLAFAFDPVGTALRIQSSGRSFM
ncbi:hypothetical protein EDB84DRAFT_1449947 [Lactarius hengduanensis]|nr:hypothetical protein EDB84DRAFT_1449947 [Lactarius hengduanensis]